MAEIVEVVGVYNGNSFLSRHRANCDEPLFAIVEGSTITFLNRRWKEGQYPTKVARDGEKDSWHSGMFMFQVLDPDTHPRQWAAYCAWRLTNAER